MSNSKISEKFKKHYNRIQWRKRARLGPDCVNLRHSGLQLPSTWCAGHFSGGKWYNQIQRKNRLRGERGQLVSTTRGRKLGKGTAGIRRAEERVC